MSFLHEKNISDKYELGDHTIFFENIYVSKVKIWKILKTREFSINP